MRDSKQSILDDIMKGGRKKPNPQPPPPPNYYHNNLEPLQRPGTKNVSGPGSAPKKLSKNAHALGLGRESLQFVVTIVKLLTGIMTGIIIVAGSFGVNILDVATGATAIAVTFKNSIDIVLFGWIIPFGGWTAGIPFSLATSFIQTVGWMSVVRTMKTRKKLSPGIALTTLGLFALMGADTFLDATPLNFWLYGLSPLDFNLLAQPTTVKIMAFLLMAFTAFGELLNATAIDIAQDIIDNMKR